MKLALRYIPTEVWVDVFIFPWITRKQLSRIVHRFKNRKFVEILQYCLHERGKRTLEDGRIIPRAPLPDNIKFFECITISNFDSLAIDFLHRVSTLLISNDVNLNTYGLSAEEGYDLANLRTAFGRLAPLLHGIHSISFDHDAIPLVEQYFTPKLGQIKMLTLGVDFWYEPYDQATVQAAINFSLNWLTLEERDSAEPRLLNIITSWEIFYQFCMAIKEQFLSAKRPCTFAVVRQCSPTGFGDDNIDFDFQLDLENNIGERLHGEFYSVGHFRIHRHQPNAGTALQEWVEKNKQCKFSNIDISEHLTIGPLDVDANVGANGVNTLGEEEADGPSTSKKAKLT